MKSSCFSNIFILFEIGSHYIALDSLELTIENRLVSNSLRSSCLCFQALKLETRDQFESVLNLKEEYKSRD